MSVEVLKPDSMKRGWLAEVLHEALIQKWVTAEDDPVSYLWECMRGPEERLKAFALAMLVQRSKAVPSKRRAGWIQARYTSFCEALEVSPPKSGEEVNGLLSKDVLPYELLVVRLEIAWRYEGDGNVSSYEVLILGIDPETGRENVPDVDLLVTGPWGYDIVRASLDLKSRSFRGKECGQGIASVIDAVVEPICRAVEHYKD